MTGFLEQHKTDVISMSKPGKLSITKPSAVNMISINHSPYCNHYIPPEKSANEVNEEVKDSEGKPDHDLESQVKKKAAGTGAGKSQGKL